MHASVTVGAEHPCQSGPCRLIAALWRRSSVIFPRRVDYWSCSMASERLISEAMAAAMSCINHRLPPTPTVFLGNIVVLQRVGLENKLIKFPL